MKKSLVALAALAVAGVASAQSTVTLSGTLDVGLEKISGQALQLQNSRNGTTQITVSGVEDLGGGLKARFQISQSFDASFDDGSLSAAARANNYPAGYTVAGNSRAGTGQRGIFGNNGMFLALDGGFGSLILGRPVNTLYGFSYTANGTKGVSGFGATSSISSQGIFTSNAIQYVTPNLSGFSAQFEYAPSEALDVKATTSLGLKYAAGPFGVTFVRDNAKATAVGGNNGTKINQLAGFYDFGVAKVSATYQDNTLAASNLDQSYVFGVNVPVGAGQFWAQYGYAEVAAGKARIVGLGYKYSLSKRTTAYVNLGNRNAAAQPAGLGKTGFGLGLQHNF